jgi:fumarylacetoacetase
MPEDFWMQKSWVESANDSALGFPLQCLPYCSFASSTAHGAAAHLGVGVGSFILDLNELRRIGFLNSLNADTQAACTAAQLNPLMRCGPPAWSALRQLLFDLLRDNATPDQQAGANPGQRDILASLLVPMEGVRFLKPVDVENYTDFYASIHHATNVGRLFRPDHPLLPNYQWIPIGYHGRASSLVISGTGIHRPNGQFKLSGEDTPVFGPTEQLDYELEVAAYIGTGNPLGTPVQITAAEHHLFGLSLLNDWSARDIQAWEAQPLGPFLGKSFATSISPWVVPMDALHPFRVPLATRSVGDPKPLPYLTESSSSQPSGIDLTLEVILSTAHMRETSLAPVRLSMSNLRDLHWSFAQMVAHHTSNGCNLLEGDLLASGTVSGPQLSSQLSSQGCLLEMTQRGTSPLRLPSGEMREFLEDGDEIILRGFCEKQGFPRITLGECRGTILPATSLS